MGFIKSSASPLAYHVKHWREKSVDVLVKVSGAWKTSDIWKKNVLIYDHNKSMYTYSICPLCHLFFCIILFCIICRSSVYSMLYWSLVRSLLFKVSLWKGMCYGWFSTVVMLYEFGARSTWHSSMVRKISVTFLLSTHFHTIILSCLSFHLIAVFFSLLFHSRSLLATDFSQGLAGPGCTDAVSIQQLDGKLMRQTTLRIA